MFCNLKAEMRRKGIIGEKLARLLGMTPSTFSMKLNGKSEFSIKEATQIKAILEVDIPLEVLFYRGDKGKTVRP